MGLWRATWNLVSTPASNASQTLDMSGLPTYAWPSEDGEVWREEASRVAYVPLKGLTDPDSIIGLRICRKSSWEAENTCCPGGSLSQRPDATFLE
jgi:hypothetical protein